MDQAIAKATLSYQYIYSFAYFHFQIAIDIKDNKLMHG